METFANRLRDALEMRKMKQVELAAATGIDKSLISNYLSGTYKAKHDNLYLIATVLDVSEAWLLGYDVSPNRKPANNDGRAEEFLQLFKLLSETEQSLVISQIKGILSNR